MKKLFNTRVSENSFSFSMLLLRLSAGGLMMVNHGFGKLQNFSQIAAGFSDPFGIGSTFSLSLTVFAEFFCAAFIVLGLFTRLAAIPLIIAMSVAFFYAHNMNFAAGKGGGEPALMFLISYIILLIAGPGKISLDRFIGK